MTNQVNAKHPGLFRLARTVEYHDFGGRPHPTECRSFAGGGSVTSGAVTITVNNPPPTPAWSSRADGAHRQLHYFDELL